MNPPDSEPVVPTPVAAGDRPETQSAGQPDPQAAHVAHAQAGHHADVESAPPVTPAATGRMVTIGVMIALVLAGFWAMSFVPRRAMSKELVAEAAGDTAAPVVEVARVQRAATGGEVELPGTIQPLHDGAIYARVTGYVKKWNVDIGGEVHAGQVLAEIDAPELAQSVQQARHQLAQMRAAFGLARADVDRWKQLVADSAVSRQEYDQKLAAYESAVADTGAAAANLQRLIDMEGYTHVTAPFTGVVTARNIDIGSLITAAGATSASVPAGGAGVQAAGSMFRIAQTDTVRMYIPVPETYATSMRVGSPAQVAVGEIPGRTFTGHIVRTSHALDVESRTLLTEVDIANPGFTLLPGMYAEVHVHFPVITPPLMIPSGALVIRSEGTQVMVVDSTGPNRAAVIHLRSVQVGRDYGSSMEILSGIDDRTLVVTNPTANLADGMRVQVTVPIVDQPTAVPARGGAAIRKNSLPTGPAHNLSAIRFARGPSCRRDAGDLKKNRDANEMKKSAISTTPPRSNHAATVPNVECRCTLLARMTPAPNTHSPAMSNLHLWRCAWPVGTLAASRQTRISDSNAERTSS